MKIYDAFCKVLPKAHVSLLEDMLPKRSIYKEQAEFKKKQLEDKGFICEITVDEYIIKIVHDNFVIFQTVDAVRLFEKDDIITVMGYDYAEGIVRFSFDIRNELEVELSVIEEIREDNLGAICLKL